MLKLCPRSHCIYADLASHVFIPRLARLLNVLEVLSAFCRLGIACPYRSEHMERLVAATGRPFLFSFQEVFSWLP